MRTFDGYKRGVNLGGWISQCVSYDEEHFQTFITEEDIKRISDWGLDHVRLPIDYDVIMEEDGTFKESGFVLIDKCIDWCTKHKIHMILDLHKTKGYMFDKQAVPNPDLFFEKEDLQDSFIEIWTELATRYSQYKNILCFELLNEIVNPKYADKWNEIAHRAVDTIRKISEDVTIIIGGVCFANIKSIPLLDAPYDEHIVHTFHCYDPMAFTHQGAYWVENMPQSGYEMPYPDTLDNYQKASQKLQMELSGAIFAAGLTTMGPEFFETLFEEAIKISEERNVALYCGEYGVIDKAPLPDTVNWLRDIHTVFEKHNIGRALWNYKQKDFGLMDEHYLPIREELVAAL